MKRSIEDILSFREDISPFLVHLTRTSQAKGASARQNLHEIIKLQQLEQRGALVSDVRFAIYTLNMKEEEKRRFFSAICFTETPLNEFHCLLDIDSRKVDLEPYGLVFLKDAMAARGVNPIFYVNNHPADKDPLMAALGGLITTAPEIAEKLLPLMSVFGRKLQPPGAKAPAEGSVDFRWEREWRFPACYGHLPFKPEEVFVGLCPIDEIEEFENAFPGVLFIDPTRNMKWFASKLVDVRKKHNLKVSVV